MILRELKFEERIYVYDNYLINDFHESEVKPFDMIEKLVEKDKYKCFGFYEDKELLGYAYFVITNNTILMDYLAVNSKYRCRGLGSKFITMIKDKFSNNYSELLAEVENPKYGVDKNDRCNRERRISFYIKNSFQQSNIETSVLEDQYKIIKLKLNVKLDDIEIKREISNVYQTIFSEEFFNKHISISLSDARSN